MSVLFTFDVFDTAITRIIGEPSSVFLLLGHMVVPQGHWAGSAEQFARARIDAETRARAHASPREVRFSEIYEELQSAYALSRAAVVALSNAELMLEERLLRPVPEIAVRIQEARRKDSAVQFISDMYLPSRTVQPWLLRMGLALGDDTVWVSSDHGVTKGGGELFDLVRSANSETYSDWLHEGDNARSDVSVPTARAIKARHFDACHLNANERAMEEFAAETCGLGPLLAGAGRWVRLNRAASVDATLQEVASGIGAPVIYAFVLWVLREARRRGHRKIWFMARDGQVMLPVARIIAERLGFDFELGYLYGGRQVVRVASLQSIDDQALDWLTGGAGLMTLQAVLDRVGVLVADVRPTVDLFGLPTDSALGWEAVDTLKRFLQHPQVASLILAQAAARRVIVLDYFRSCGLIGSEHCAVVDIGWKGNVLRSIVDLIGVDQAAQHTFMYFGSYGHAKSCESVPRTSFLFDIRGAKRFGLGQDIPSMTTIMEILCQADHGQVMHLERKGDQILPVCRPDDAGGDSASRWNVTHFQTAVRMFADTVAIELLPAVEVDLRGLCDRLLRRLALYPTPDEIGLISPIGFVDDQGGSQPHPFAHAYQWEHVRLAYRIGESAPSLGLNWWRAAAVSLTPKAIRWCMRAAAKAKRAGFRWRIGHIGKYRASA